MIEPGWPEGVCSIDATEAILENGVADLLGRVACPHVGLGRDRAFRGTLRS
jgi:hypothetical protein